MTVPIILNPAENEIKGTFNNGDKVLVKCDASRGAFSVTIPDAEMMEGIELRLIKIGTDLNYVTFNGYNATGTQQTIKSEVQQKLRRPGNELVINSDDTNWI